MIVLLALLIKSHAPPTMLHVARASNASFDIRLVQPPGEGPLVPLAPLAEALGGRVQRDGLWIVLATAGGNFRFLPGTPVVEYGSTVRGLAGVSRARGDSLDVPLAFVAEVLADPRRQAWSWSPATAVLSEGAAPIPLTIRPSRTTVATDQRSRSPSGFRRSHLVTIDPGHGGTDPGNPGMFFPRGLREKDVTLAVGLLVRDELVQRGVKVRMTRTTDTLINLGQRAPRFCQTDCDLFVSIHVNSLNPRPGYTAVRGFETYFLSEARSADAARVARMENDAVRYDTPGADSTPVGGLDFMLKDLQNGAMLRQSQEAAALIQTYLSEVHDGTDQGVKQAGFAVLNTARRPSVLVEMGYATNRDDAALMTSPDGQRKLAANIARAIITYLRQNEAETIDSSGDAGP
ncbi:MAG TPA: N-acetylmuramoyl-L-alanine amidase [Gemmatimonadales bacterium]